MLIKIVFICRRFSLCRRWDSNPHEVALTGFFESDKNCGIVRDAALRGAFMSLFAFLCGIVCVRVRPDCHQNYPAKLGYREGRNWCDSIGIGVSLRLLAIKVRSTPRPAVRVTRVLLLDPSTEKGVAKKKGQGYAARTSACSNIAVSPAIVLPMPLLMAAISCALSYFAQRM